MSTAKESTMEPRNLNQKVHIYDEVDELKIINEIADSDVSICFEFYTYLLHIYCDSYTKDIEIAQT